jgi:hypothetical protein
VLGLAASDRWWWLQASSSPIRSQAHDARSLSTFCCWLLVRGVYPIFMDGGALWGMTYSFLEGALHPSGENTALIMCVAAPRLPCSYEWTTNITRKDGEPRVSTTSRRGSRQQEWLPRAAAGAWEGAWRMCPPFHLEMTPGCWQCSAMKRCVLLSEHRSAAVPSEARSRAIQTVPRRRLPGPGRGQSSPG